MKSLESLESCCAAKGDKKNTLFPLLKKVDLLYEVLNEIKTLDKKGLNAVKKRIVAVLDLLCNEEAGAMLTRLVTKVHEEIFAQVDKSRLPQFFDKEIQQVSSGKVDASYRINHLYIIGKIYQRFAAGMMTVPTPELITAVNKLIKNSTEWYAKESAILCLRRIIKGNASNINTHWTEIFKNLGKHHSDKSVEVRLQISKCYKESARIMTGATLIQFYDTIYQMGLKGFEDDQACVREQYVEALASLISTRLQESSYGDTGSKASKKKSQELPKNFLNVYANFQGPFMKEKDNVRDCIVLCIWKIMKKSPEQIAQTKPLTFLQLELNWLSKGFTSPIDNYKARVNLSWLLIEYTKLIDLPAQMKLKDTIIANLSKILERSSKGSQQANDQQIILILSAFSSLVLELGPHVVEHNSSLSLITDIINPFLAWERAPVRLAASECVKALMHRCRSWICQLLSLFLNMTTVAHAELSALTPSPLFVIPKGQVVKENLMNFFTTLTVQSGCLSSLLYCTENLLHGVPLDIANSALVSARGIIMGYHQHESDDTKASPSKSKEAELLAKRHAGWIVVQGLLGLGMSWVSGNLSTLMKLWNTAFTKETCVLTELPSADMENLTEDFLVKAEALRAMHDFVVNYKGLMNQQLIKFVAGSLSNCSLYLFQNCSKEPKKSIFDMFPVKYMQMKYDIWDALGILPTNTYEEAHISLLHNLADAITTSTYSPNIYKHWESADELNLISKDDQSVCHAEGLEILNESCDVEPHLRIYDLPDQLTYNQGPNNSLRIRLVDTAIKLYTNIFCSSHLSHKNRIQLCKHLQAHLMQPDANPNKQLTIIVLCYSIARHFAKSPSTCESLPEPDQIFTLLQSMGEFACTTSGHLLRSLGCELIALLHRAFNDTLHSAVSSLISELGKLINSTDVLSRSKAALVAGYLFKHFDSDKLQFFIKQIEKIITNQLKDSHTLSKFNGFFAMYLVLKYTGSVFLDTFKDDLALCLHNYNTDIRLDKTLFAVMCRIFELVSRIRPEMDQGKLPILVFDAFMLSRCNHSVLALSILEFAKYNILIGSSVVTPRQCIDLALRNIKNPDASTSAKKLSLEILGIVIYQGNFKTIQQVDASIVWRLLEELNAIKGGKQGVSYAYNKKQTKKLLKLYTWKLDLEKSFGINNKLEHDNTQTKFSELIDKSEELIYGYCLKQLIIYIFIKIMEEKGGINIVMEMVKYILNYRILSEEALKDRSTRSDENKEGIVSKDRTKDTSYKFKMSIRMGTKTFIIKLLRKLIMNETRESELILLVNQFPNLLSLSFSFINIEANPQKDAAFRLIKSAIKQCKDIKDTVVPLNDEEEETDLHNGLEQFEAQINALIRQYATKNSSYDALENIFSIFYYLCSIPISRDQTALGKLMTQMVEPLKGLSLTGSVEFSCEKDALKSHFKRLKVLCRLYFIGVNAKFNAYLKDNDGKFSNKFIKPADRKRIQELFTEKIEEYLVKHIIAALNDCWFVLTQKKAVAKQKTNYILIHSGVPSAFSANSCESSVLCFLKYLSICSNKPSVQVVIKENINVIIPFILHFLSKKPEAKVQYVSEFEKGDISEKLGEALLHKNDLLIAMELLVRQLKELEISEELLKNCLNFLEKLTDTKIIEFAQNIVNIIDQVADCLISKKVEMNKQKVFAICEEVLGKIWLQFINPQAQNESQIFLQAYNCWAKILTYYAQTPDFESQFQSTFSAIISGSCSLIPSAEINISKLYAKLSMTTIKQLFKLSSLQPFAKCEIAQFLQGICSLIQNTETASEKIDVLFIVAMNCATSLASVYSEDMSKAFADFLELLDITRSQSEIFKTATAIIKANAAELKDSPLSAMIFEHMIQKLYKSIEIGECENTGQKLQIVVLLYQLIGKSSETFFKLLFSLHLGFCSNAFSNKVLKEALASMNLILTINPAFFKASITQLSQREVKYLQLLMRLYASNKID